MVEVLGGFVDETQNSLTRSEEGAREGLRNEESPKDLTDVGYRAGPQRVAIGSAAPVTVTGTADGPGIRGRSGTMTARIATAPGLEQGWRFPITTPDGGRRYPEPGPDGGKRFPIVGPDGGWYRR